MSSATSTSVSTPNSSLWKLPGLDKDTFYAAALLLSVAKGNIEVGRHHREPKTPEDVRDFLDHLADCFARSKLQDRSDHVSATAMVRNETQKTITLYIAKNQSEKGFGPSGSLEERGEVHNENNDFAKSLIEWFNLPDGEDATLSNRDNPQGDSTIFKTMCDFNRSRLDYYIEEIRKANVGFLDSVVKVNLGADLDARSLKGWGKANHVITECQRYKTSTENSPIPSEEDSALRCAQLAGDVRENADFQRFASVVETLPESKRNKAKELIYVAGGIKYLGRLFAAYKHFQYFCNIERQKGFSFDYNLLPSSDSMWDGDAYLRKIKSWAEILNLSELQKSIDSETDPGVQKKISDIVKKRNNKAPVHCEMQLLMHFSGPNAEKCEDYFGCSKKSCWLCWQMILRNSRFVMKDTHRKIYPAWVFPFDYSASQPAIAEGLITAYNNMMSPIQETLIKRTPFTFLEPLVQSSIRMTPAYRCGPLNSYSDDSAKSEKFPEPIIAVSDRWPAHSVKAIHLPEHGSPTTSRIVDIHAYEATLSELGRFRMISHSFDEQELIFAFQLRTNAESLSLNSGIEEYQQALWSFTLFSDLHFSWNLYYRTAYETLSANPYISSLCAKTQPEISQPIPWRGDIFIFQKRISSADIDFRSESTFDEPACLKALERAFRQRTKEWDPVKVAEDETQEAGDELEYYKNRLRGDTIRERMKMPVSADELRRLRQQSDELSQWFNNAQRRALNAKVRLSEI